MKELENQQTYEDDEEEEDNSFIKIVSRNHQIFKNIRSTFYYVEDGKVTAEKMPTIPDEVIICDGCNNLIMHEEIGLLMLDEDRCWGTQCKTCVKEFFSELPVVRDDLIL